MRALEIAYYAFAAISFTIVPYAGFYLFAETFNQAHHAPFEQDKWPLSTTIKYLVITLAALSLSCLFLQAGRSLNKRCNPKLIKIAAILILPFPPFGTILGILTLRLLAKPQHTNQFKS